MKKVREGKLEFHTVIWDKIGKDAKDFIKALLTMDPEERPTAE
jgi:calcium/calmodulin-dependent protein kinase I